jgi:hypothetical protein
MLDKYCYGFAKIFKHDFEKFSIKSLWHIPENVNIMN